MFCNREGGGGKGVHVLERGRVHVLKGGGSMF